MLRARSIRMARLSAAGPSNSLSRRTATRALLLKALDRGGRFLDGCCRRGLAGRGRRFGRFDEALFGQRAQGGFGFRLDQRLQIRPASAAIHQDEGAAQARLQPVRPRLDFGHALFRLAEERVQIPVGWLQCGFSCSRSTSGVAKQKAYIRLGTCPSARVVCKCNL